MLLMGGKRREMKVTMTYHILWGDAVSHDEKSCYTFGEQTLLSTDTTLMSEQYTADTAGPA